MYISIRMMQIHTINLFNTILEVLLYQKLNINNKYGKNNRNTK